MNTPRVRIEVIAPSPQIGGQILEAWRAKIALFNEKNPVDSFKDGQERYLKVKKEADLFAAEFDMIFEIIEDCHRFFYVGKTFVPHRAPVDIFQQFGIS